MSSHQFYRNTIIHFSTYLGEPIPYDPAATPESLALRVMFIYLFDLSFDFEGLIKVKEEIEKMIDTHQRRPGSITRAFLDRFISTKKSR